jgi:hypothetical protein
LSIGHGSVRGSAIMIVAAGSLWFATTRRPAMALAVLMLYLGLLDGYLKLASGSSAVTFVRDALLFSLVIGVLVRAAVSHTRLTLPPLSGWILAFVVVVVVQVANPQGGTLVHSVAGIRQHLEFVPLFFLTFAFVRTTKALRGFVIVLLLIGAANGVVSWVQFHQTPDQLASWGPGYAERILGTGQFAQSGRTFHTQDDQTLTRPFGLGSESGSGGLVGAFALAGALALASRFRRMRHLLFSVAMAIGATAAVVTSQGRGAVIASVVIVITYIILSATGRGRWTVLLGLVPIALVSYLVVHDIASTAGSSRLRYQGLAASSIVKTTNDARGKSIARIPKNIVDYPLGAGLATAGPAAIAPGGTGLVGAVDTESEFSFMTIETGIAGLLLVTAFTAMLVVLGVRRCRHEPDPEARVLLAAIIAPVAGMLVLYLPSPLTATTPGAPYLWAAGGIVAYWLLARPRQVRAASSS